MSATASPSEDEAGSQPSDAPEGAELLAYVEEMVSDAIRAGGIDPVRGLECFLYAADRELADSLRAFARLSPEHRRHILSHASNGTPVEGPLPLVH
jgi:hypothetical protein